MFQRNGTVHAIDKVMLATGANIVASAQACWGGSVFKKTRTNILVAAVSKIRITYFIRSILRYMHQQTQRSSQQDFQM
jgi:hypothetical protein